MNLDILLGVPFCIMSLAILALLYVKHIDALYSDMAAEEAERLADERFEEYKKNMRIRVTQTLRIVDERNLTK